MSFVKMLASGQIKSEDGIFTIGGRRQLIVNFETFRVMMDEMSNQLGGNVKAVYRIGKAGGKAFGEIGEQFVIDKETFLSEILELTSFSGWGNFTVEDFDEVNGRAIIKCENSVFADRQGTEPACHVTRGLVAGVCSYLFKQDVDAIETTCAAKGDQFCTFKIMKLGDFPEKDKPLVAAQI